MAGRGTLGGSEGGLEGLAASASPERLFERMRVLVSEAGALNAASAPATVPILNDEVEDCEGDIDADACFEGATPVPLNPMKASASSVAATSLAVPR